MATGTLAATLDPAAPLPYKQGREFVQRVIVTPTGNYGTGGVAVSLSGLSTPGNSIPFEWYIYGEGSANTYSYDPGTNRSDGVLSVFVAGVESTGDAAYPADTIRGTFRYKA